MNNYNKKIFFILTLVFMLGVFLRVYNFHDWLRFNMDQGRDALIIGSVVDGSSPIPLLGARAGGTDFYLGPMSYYFQIVSAKIFGNYPDKMAYPDLFFSIACIPLLYFFLRKYFSVTISASLTGIFAFSFYAVYYSRFAWNPNSTPFWTILSLYAIHNIIAKSNIKKMLWAVIAGIAIGVSMQLHTILFLSLPIITISIFGFLLARNVKVMRYFFVILFCSLFLNVPQFIHEYQTGGKNTKEFFKGIQTKEDISRKNGSPISLIEKVARNQNCWVESGILTITGYEISDSCQLKWDDNFYNPIIYLIGLIFFLGGIILGLRFMWLERGWDRKTFLAIVFLFIGTCYLIYVPLSFGLTMRFFIMMIFFPLILVGLWIDFFKCRLKGNYKYFGLIFLCILIIANLIAIKNYFQELADYQTKTGKASDLIRNVTLKEMEIITNFILENSNGQKDIYINGKNTFITKTYSSLKFLTSKSGVNLFHIDERSKANGSFFYLTSSRQKNKILRRKNPPKQYLIYGRMMIYLDQNINEEEIIDDKYNYL